MRLTRGTCAVDCHAELENLDGILFAADIEKAFDSSEHNFIFATLTGFGFGQKFIQWVRTFLRNGSSCYEQWSLNRIF